MKKNIFILVALTATFFFSCSSKQTQTETQVQSPNTYVGNTYVTSVGGLTIAYNFINEKELRINIDGTYGTHYSDLCHYMSVLDFIKKEASGSERGEAMANAFSEYLGDYILLGADSVFVKNRNGWEYVDFRQYSDYYDEVHKSEVMEFFVYNPINNELIVLDTKNSENPFDVFVEQLEQNESDEIRNTDSFKTYIMRYGSIIAKIKHE